jgi:hypothetical protein
MLENGLLDIFDTSQAAKDVEDGAAYEAARREVLSSLPQVLLY